MEYQWEEGGDGEERNHHHYPGVAESLVLQMSSAERLLEALENAGLERFYSTFIGRSVDSLERLAGLIMQDYQDYGISNPDDRRTLFTLIAKIKNGTVLEKRAGKWSIYLRIDGLMWLI